MKRVKLPKLRLPKFRAPKMFRKNEKLFWSIVVIVTAVIIGIVAWQLSSGNGSSPNNKAPNNVLPVAPTEEPIEILITPVENSVTGVMVEYGDYRGEPTFTLHIPIGIRVRSTSDIEVPLSRLNNLHRNLVRISFQSIQKLRDNAQTSSYIDSTICNLDRYNIPRNMDLNSAMCSIHDVKTDINPSHFSENFINLQNDNRDFFSNTVLYHGVLNVYVYKETLIYTDILDPIINCDSFNPTENFFIADFDQDILVYSLGIGKYSASPDLRTNVFTI